MQYAPLTQAELNRLKDMRNAQTGFGALLGMEVVTLTHEKAQVTLSLGNPSLLNATGNTTHGGAIFSLADTAAGVAAWASGFFCATASANIHYIAPTLDATMLTATAIPLQRGKRLSVFDVGVVDETGRLIAQGTFSYMPLNRRILEAM